MNIRKAVIAIGAMLLSFGFFGASPALAYTPKSPCVAWHGFTGAWPTINNFFVCDGTGAFGVTISAPALAAATQANATRQTLNGKLATGLYDLFYFDNPEDANGYTDFATDVPEIGPGVRGFTISTQGTNHLPPVLMVFGRGCRAPSCQYYPTLDVKRATNHEVGHALDILKGTPSAQNTWRTKFNTDSAAYDLLPLTWQGLPSSCTSQPTNTLKLACWFGMDKTKFGNQTYLSKEFFAEEYACKASNGTVPIQASIALCNSFRTSTDYVFTLVTQP